LNNYPLVRQLRYVSHIGKIIFIIVVAICDDENSNFQIIFPLILNAIFVCLKLIGLLGYFIYNFFDLKYLYIATIKFYLQIGMEISIFIILMLFLRIQSDFNDL
jgi:hypothetical protein